MAQPTIHMPMTDDQYAALKKLQSEGVDGYLSIRHVIDRVTHSDAAMYADVRLLEIKNDDQEVVHRLISPDGSVVTERLNGLGAGWTTDDDEG